MLDKIKGLGGQISNLASNAVDGVTSSVKEGASAVAEKTSSAVSSATQAVTHLGQKVNDKATREAIGQIRDVLAIAVDELRRRPIIDGPVTLTGKLDVMVAAIEIQIVVDGQTQLLSPPPLAKGEAAAEPAKPAEPGKA